MGDQRKHGIEWTDETWNPLRGCTAVSEGCRNCYAARQAMRMAGPGEAYEGLVRMVNGHPQWAGKVRLVPELYSKPLSWTRPRRVFVNSMSDLGHEGIPASAWCDIFLTMERASQHQFQVLTKRPEILGARIAAFPWEGGVSPKHVWWGVSVEDQASYDARMPVVEQWKAQLGLPVIWLSVEPLLGAIDPAPLKHRGTNVNQDDWLASVDWVVAGGESGPGARPMHPAWARAWRDACTGRRDMGRPWPLPFLFKQWGDWAPCGPVEDDPRFAGGRAFSAFWGGRCAIRLARAQGRRYRLLDEATVMERVGKGKAGRELDGRAWDQYPDEHP